MTSNAHTPDTRELLSRTARMRALARRLVSDAAAADDLVQTALLRAIEGDGTQERESSVAWYSVVLKNLARDRSRREGRRRAREESVARPEGLPETVDAAANAERQRDVADAVLGLKEPYRTVVLLRFFEELRPREIAKRTGRSSETVRKQVTRGLQQLRAKLEARYGGSGSWAVALLPLSGRDVIATTGVGASALGIGSAARAVAVILAVLGAVFGVRTLAARDVGPATVDGGGVVDLAQRVAVLSADEALQTAPIQPEIRALVDTPAVDDPPEAAVEEVETDAVALPTWRFAARVVGLDSEPIVDVPLRWGEPTVTPRRKGLLGGLLRVLEPDPSVTLRSDGDGWIRSLRVPVLRDVSEFACLDERWVILEGGVDDDQVLHIVLAPAVHLAGRTIDKDGSPVAGARVTVAATFRAVPSFTLKLNRISFASGRSVVTDAGGAFDLGRVATHPDFRVEAARKGGARVNEFMVPAFDDMGLELEMDDPVVQARPVIKGRVYESTGAVAQGCLVRFGQDHARTDALGHFEVTVSSWVQGAFLSVRSADGRFATTDVPDRAEFLTQPNPDDVVLRLPARMAVLMGQVVEHDLTPVPGLEVFLLDATRVGRTSRTHESGPLKTDKRGCFVFRHLLDRPYHIRILDQVTMASHDVEDVLPGGGFLRIVLAEDRLAEEITGTVLDYYRQPVSGASVTIDVKTSPMMSLVGRAVLTDQDGVFKIENAPWRNLVLSVDARLDDHLAGKSFQVGDRARSGPLELVLDIQCQVHVVLRGEPDVTRIEVLDDAGAKLYVIATTAGASMGEFGANREPNGRFPLFDVSQRAVTLVLMAGETEVRRVPARFSATERNEVQL